MIAHSELIALIFFGLPFLSILNWTKQKIDKKVNGEIVFKTRDSIESQVYPTAKIIGDLTPKDKPDEAIGQQVEIDAKYSGYISRQKNDIDRLQRHENTPIPIDFDYSHIKGLSNEVQQKLSEVLPDTLAKAARIPGITPAAVSLLLVQLKRRAA